MNSYHQFHDGSLEGLWIDDSTVHVYLRTTEKERFMAVAKGVMALTAGGFKAGNIIFEVLIRDHGEITLQDISQV
jgi:hypothetical protein